MDVIILRAWMLWPMDALVASTVVSFGHGCSGQWMHWYHGRHHHSGQWMLCPRSTQIVWTLSYFGCSGQCMHRRHGRHHPSGMDFLDNGCSCSKDVIILRAWMLWPMELSKIHQQPNEIEQTSSNNARKRIRSSHNSQHKAKTETVTRISGNMKLANKNGRKTSIKRHHEGRPRPERKMTKLEGPPSTSGRHAQNGARAPGQPSFDPNPLQQS